MGDSRVIVVETEAGPDDMEAADKLIALKPCHAGGVVEDGARVLAYDDQGMYRLVRDGDNGLSCVADNPGAEGFEVVCYHSELEAYMARGREMRAEGMTGSETVAARGEEIQAGTLAFTEGPSTLYIRYGDEAYYDEESGEVMDSRLRYVIYTPYATAATTGLPTQPAAPGAPWLMLPGDWRAHIMITPPAPAATPESEDS